MYSYVGLTTLKTELGLTGDKNDVLLRNLAETVARQFDEHLGRTFRSYLATRYYTPRSSQRLLLDGDLLSVTTLKSDEDGDRVYETTWAAGDYDLMPFNAAADKRPYWEIAVTPDGDHWFQPVRRGVEVVGKWGYWEDLVTVTSLAAEALDATETGVDVDNGGDFEPLQTILVDAEQMYVTGINSNTLTVVRAVNGTTAATHLDNAVIQVYRYPWQVAKAAILHATKMWARRSAGYSDRAGMVDTGLVPIREGMDWAVVDLLAFAHRLAAV